MQFTVIIINSYNYFCHIYDIIYLLFTSYLYLRLTINKVPIQTEYIIDSIASPCETVANDGTYRNSWFICIFKNVIFIQHNFFFFIRFSNFLLRFPHLHVGWPLSWEHHKLPITLKKCFGLYDKLESIL